MKRDKIPYKKTPNEDKDSDDRKSSAANTGDADLDVLEPDEEIDTVEVPKKISSAFDVIEKTISPGDDEIDELNFDD